MEDPSLVDMVPLYEITTDDGSGTSIGGDSPVQAAITQMMSTLFAVKTGIASVQDSVQINIASAQDELKSEFQGRV